MTGYIACHFDFPIEVTIRYFLSLAAVAPNTISFPPSFILSFFASSGAWSGKFLVETLIFGLDFEKSLIAFFENGIISIILNSSPGNDSIGIGE